jgi:hypothetical protein
MVGLSNCPWGHMGRGVEGSKVSLRGNERMLILGPTIFGISLILITVR